MSFHSTNKESQNNRTKALFQHFDTISCQLHELKNVPEQFQNYKKVLQEKKIRINNEREKLENLNRKLYNRTKRLKQIQDPQQQQHSNGLEEDYESFKEKYMTVKNKYNRHKQLEKEANEIVERKSIVQSYHWNSESNKTCTNNNNNNNNNFVFDDEFHSECNNNYDEQERVYNEIQAGTQAVISSMGLISHELESADAGFSFQLRETYINVSSFGNDMIMDQFISNSNANSNTNNQKDKKHYCAKTQETHIQHLHDLLTMIQNQILITI
eukprot:Pgem_evm1s1719